jgi:4-diphosphocytidyl-2-C-methyl-D-erythritol kinase
MTLRAYAKINLGLQILAERPDGYHEIETVYHQVNLGDEIELLPSEEGIRLTCDNRDVPTDERNLCVQAVKLLQQITNRSDGVDIILRKRIPMGAGLGGSSTDAAVVLKGLRKLWGLDISDAELRTLAASLGSDVPFFIDGGTAYATGRGEQLEPFELEMPYWILIATPPVQISTAWAYHNLVLNPTLRRENLKSLVSDHLNEPRILVNKLRNDFEPLIFRQYPEVLRIKEQLVRGGADLALMSGSGSSVFGLFRNETSARELAEAFAPLYRVALSEPTFKPEPLFLSE